MNALRFQDRTLTLRLFRSEASAAAYPGATQPTRYGAGWIAKNNAGRWVDAFGPLPADWEPIPEHMGSSNAE